MFAMLASSRHYPDHRLDYGSFHVGIRPVLSVCKRCLVRQHLSFLCVFEALVCPFRVDWLYLAYQVLAGVNSVPTSRGQHLMRVQ